MKFQLQKKFGGIWFLIWFLCSSIYLIIKAICRYIEFKVIMMEQVFDVDIDRGVMHFYLGCIITAIVSSILCVFCVTIQVGNYANDSMKFGDNDLSFKDLKVQFERGHSSCTCNFVVRMKKHFPPYYLMLYFLMSVSLLLALPYFNSEKIKDELANTNSLMHSNLDIIFKEAYDLTSLSHNNEEAYYQRISFEYINVCICLVLHTFAYSSVFWKFNKGFTLIFSIIIFVSGIVFLLDIALVEMLIKVSRHADVRLYICNPALMTTLSLLSYLLLIVHQMALFEYGFMRLGQALLQGPRKEQIDNSQDNTVIKHSCSAYATGVAFLTVVLSICCRLSYLYKSITLLYLQHKNGLILLNVSAALVLFLLTTILWICMILKTQWPIRSWEPTDLSSYYQARSINRGHTAPICAPVNSYKMTTLPLDNSRRVFHDQNNRNWRYSCSLAPGGISESNSDRNSSLEQRLNMINNDNNTYVRMQRRNHTSSSPNATAIHQEAYTYFLNLIPQNSEANIDQTENSVANLIIPKAFSDTSDNQTVLINGRESADQFPGTIDRATERQLTTNSPEYLNIIDYCQNALNSNLYEHHSSINNDASSIKMCSQV